MMTKVLSRIKTDNELDMIFLSKDFSIEFGVCLSNVCMQKIDYEEKERAFIPTEQNDIARKKIANGVLCE